MSVIVVLLDMCPSVITDKTINWVCGLYTFIAVVSYQNITLQMMYANVFSFGLSMSRRQVVVVVICNVSTQSYGPAGIVSELMDDPPQKSCEVELRNIK